MAVPTIRVDHFACDELVGTAHPTRHLLRHRMLRHMGIDFKIDDER